MTRECNNRPLCGDRTLRFNLSLRTIRTGRAASRGLLLAALACSASMLAAAGDHGPVARAPAVKSHHWLQTGIASWYGTKFQGKKTATGERFDMNSLTCAHPSLPLGSWIRVTNLHNRKSIFVRVNDRGPVVENRIIDLSYAAAHAVGLVGIGKVKLEAVNANDPEMEKALVAQLTFPQSALTPVVQ